MKRDLTGKFVVFTTDKDRRGVFCGKLISWNEETGLGEFEECRMAVRFTAAGGGVIGLGNKGPLGGRVSPAVEYIRLRGVDCVYLCSEEALTVWRSEPWV